MNNFILWLVAVVLLVVLALGMRQSCRNDVPHPAPTPHPSPAPHPTPTPYPPIPPHPPAPHPEPSPAPTPAEHEISGKVEKVISSDTLVIRHRLRRVTVHLAGLRAPAEGSPFFEPARQFVETLLEQLGHELTVVDGIASWTHGGVSLNLRVVDDGWAAFANTGMTNNDEKLRLQHAADNAKSQSLGMWRK